MRVYKFGGASVKDARGIRNLAAIVKREKDNLAVVVSAFGKTTNALEMVLKAWMENDPGYKDHLDNIYSYHASVAGELFSANDPVRDKIDSLFASLRKYLKSTRRSYWDFEYDQIVSYGELWSTIIVAEYLRQTGIESSWIDIRKCLLTDNRYRDANILWDESSEQVKKIFSFKRSSVLVTQGFIGANRDGWSTTLGREGSDYTAAVLANMLDAESVTVWKDVPGLLNADPKWLSDAEIMEEISYKEAVEMTFSGAKVIHPKTIKPLHNKNIPLHVKSFLNPDSLGTVVKADASLRKVMPVYIRKEKQLLISVLPKDFSFVMGDNLSRIFQSFNTLGIKVNLVEASAISINVCVDDERTKIDALLTDLKNDYSVFYNEDLEMLSIRHYTPEAIKRITSGREILLEQKARSTVRFVVRTAQWLNGSADQR
jgi:aspartate kinase